MSQSPNVKFITGSAPARAAAADGTEPLGRVPFNATITSITYLARAGITGANTDTRDVSVVNKGTDGLGSAVPGIVHFVSGNNAVANKEKELTLSATAADLEVDEGDILAVVSAHVGSTGLADPGGVVLVKIARRPTAI